jgi:hypothetical protein
MISNERNKVRITAVICLVTNAWAFSSFSKISRRKLFGTNLYLRAPPGSGYADMDDEIDYYPDTYDPMMEYPGTMRPGSTPENQPYSSLPIQESDPDPVPWPHFQEIEWHHNWGSPHEHAIPMEDFIDMNGRWATAEMEAEMRAGARRGVRERRELEEAQKAASFILDDDEDDDDEEEDQVKLDLGQGVEAFIGTDAKPVAVEDAVTEEDVDDEDDDDDGDDFLLDLGLDGGDATEDAAEEEGEEPAFASGEGTESILEAMQTMIDAEDDTEEGAEEETGIDLNFDDLDLDFGEDDEDDEEVTAEDDDGEDGDFVLLEDDEDDTEEMIPLDDMIGDEDMGDDDEFDDGGFDYD